jgi:hypothetical protein
MSRGPISPNPIPTNGPGFSNTQSSNRNSNQVEEVITVKAITGTTITKTVRDNNELGRPTIMGIEIGYCPI